MEEAERLNIRKWIGLAIIAVGTIMAFFSQFLPWHSYQNIYSLGSSYYKVIVYLQTSLVAIVPILTYLPLIGAFIGLGGCLLVLFPFSIKIGRYLGIISGIIVLIGYILFPIFYYLIGLIFSMFGMSLVELMFPTMIGGLLCLISVFVLFTGAIVCPSEEIVEEVVEDTSISKKGKKEERAVKLTKCIACGAMIRETDQFCPECGAFQ